MSDSKEFKYNNINADAKYVGEIKNGLPNGQGTQTWNNGAKYVGEWKNGLRHGKGSFTFEDGERYEGSWISGDPDGHGTIISQNGVSYQDVEEFREYWFNDYQEQYEDVYEDEYGRKIDYELINDSDDYNDDDDYNKTVEGVLQMGEGVYSGEIKNGEPNGFGTYTTSQEEYIGEFKDGLKHGRGTLFHKGPWENFRTEGVWEEGFPVDTNDYDLIGDLGDVKLGKFRSYKDDK